MPKKSVREMNDLERQHYSLSARVFHATLMGALIIGLATLAVGLGLYLYALAGQYISEAFNLTRSAASIVEKVADPAPLAEKTMEIYRGLSEEELDEVGTEGYRDRFDLLTEDPDYGTIRSVLADFAVSSDVEFIYMAMYDAEHNALVYFCDPDENPETALLPGDWEPVEQREVEKFLNWDGSGRLYDIGDTEKYGYMCTSGVPIRSSSGEIVAFVLADISLDNVRNGIKTFLFQYLAALLLVVAVYAVILNRHMKKTVVQPINAIAEAAQNYAADKRAGIQNGERFARLNIRTGDEIENLSLVMADMEMDLADYEDNLTKVTAEKERINTELALATRIQADMLPNIFPAFPERKDIDIYASMTPAKEVGGDFYDFFLLDEDHLGLVMADVSGKGVPAALFMMVSKILVQNYAAGARSPASVLEKVNAQICSNNREEMFITIWFGILDMRSGRLTAANAGHEYPVLMPPGGVFELVKDRHGFVIGGMDGVRYREYELQMEPGSKLFLYTDGVPEAVNPEKEMFGLDRTVTALNEARTGTPRKILESVNSAVAQFVGDAEAFDDLTMLCVHYIGEKESQ